MKEALKIQLANYAGLYRSMQSPSAPKPPSKPASMEKEKEVFEEAAKAWASYSNSPEGKKELAAVEHMDLQEVRSYVASLPDKPVFVKLISWIRSLDLPESSFTIGLSFEAELVIGFSGTIGVAIGVGNSKGMQTAEFLALSLEEGLEIGVMGGVQFGLWNSTPADLEGYRWGTEIDLGFEAEMSAGIYYTSDGISGIAVTLGIGVEDGIAEVECYIFILGDQGADPYIKPVVQPRKNNFLIIESLKCVHPSNDGAGDENEIYFIFQADGDTQYPYPTYDYFSMKEGETWQCGRSVWFNSSVAVTVYDEDGSSDNDVVGTFSISLSQLSPGKSVTFKSTKDYSSRTDAVEYTINVKLVAQNVPAKVS
ncbi:hypothetical protein ACFOTA_14835 [Chitinophaga sp. GCM10012297]|uniref:Ig-like domain-containing protein n=1 Tax=Chitinophaga chungangae TaxID=2821488 RepID=A0ABS3YFP0_9BACT|nr:hypothetical protein [Chitinophaga chungangae]MBO9153494.1 hypothetical protein [Chitinophaga chungangae]